MPTKSEKIFLGIDTSNYTTSLCLVDDDKRILSEAKRLLPVAAKSVGLRQSDALFYHTKALPELYTEVLSKLRKDVGSKICAIGYSARPRDVAGSYMPCFLAGKSLAVGISQTLGIELFDFSHQAGHIKAAVETTNAQEKLSDDFLSYHVSGGTTEIIRTSKNNVSYDCTIIGGTNDLNAGQAIDRTGVQMGLVFPCGKEMDKLSSFSNASFKNGELKICVKDGYFNLSGLENMAKKRIDDGDSVQDVSKFVFTYLAKVLKTSCLQVRKIYGDLPVCFAGGVMSNTIIRNELSELENVYFAMPEYSCDNAFGIACLCADAFRNQER